MNAFVRLASIWLLALCLPLQAASAATMFGCCLPSSGAVRMAAHGHMHVADDVERQHAVSAHAMHLDHGRGQAEPGQQHKCGVCATCSAGVWLPSTLASCERADQSAVYRPLSVNGHVAFLTQGIERPPKPVFA